MGPLVHYLFSKNDLTQSAVKIANITHSFIDDIQVQVENNPDLNASDKKTLNNVTTDLIQFTGYATGIAQGLRSQGEPRLSKLLSNILNNLSNIAEDSPALKVASLTLRTNNNEEREDRKEKIYIKEVLNDILYTICLNGLDSLQTKIRDESKDRIPIGFSEKIKSKSDVIEIDPLHAGSSSYSR